jgi:hypothetical protein
MEHLATLIKLLAAPARLGAAAALMAAVIVVGKKWNFYGLSIIDDATMQWIVIAGILGGCLSIVDFIMLLFAPLKAGAKRLAKWLGQRKSRRHKRLQALANFACIEPKQEVILAYLKMENTPRFLEKTHHLKLDEMLDLGFLEYDGWSPNQSKSAYVVPPYIWEKLDHLEKKYEGHALNQAPWNVSDRGRIVI